MTPQDAHGPPEPATQPKTPPRTSGVWPTAKGQGRGPRLLLWLALLGAAASGAFMLGRPFGLGNFDGWLGGWYGVVARNLATHGFWQLRFAPYPVPGAPASGVYLHHPVTMANVWGASVWLFGDHEWALRLPSVLAGLAAVVLCGRIGARLLGAWGGAATAAMVASTPMFGLFSSQVHYEPFVLAASAGAYLVYLRYLEAPSTGRLAALVGALALAVLVDWFGALIAVPIAAHLLRARGRRAVGPIAVLGAAACGVVALHLLHAFWVDPDAIQGLWHAALHRAGNRQDDVTTATFTWSGYLLRHAKFARMLYGPKALFLLLLAGGVALGWRRHREPAVHALLLLLPGLSIVGIFRQVSFQHGFSSFPLLLGTGLGGALGLTTLAAWRPTRFPRGGLVLASALGLTVVSAGQWQTWYYLRDLVSSPIETAPRHIGQEVHAVVARGETVATPGGRVLSHIWVPAQYYADRPIFWELGTLEAIDRAREDGSHGHLRYIVFLPRLHPVPLRIVKELERRGAPKLWKEGGEVLFFDLDAGGARERPRPPGSAR